MLSIRVVRTSSFVLMSALAAFSTMRVQATDRTWSGATSITWGTGSNWGGTAPIVAADNAKFSAAFARQPQVQANTTIGGIWVTGTPTPPSGGSIQITRSSSFALTLAGNTINSIPGLGILVDNTDGTVLDLRLPIAVSNNQEWRNTTNVTVLLNNSSTTISGAGNLTLRGTGGDLASAFRVDARPESFTGQLTIAQGVYRTTQANNVSSAGPLGNSAAAVTLGEAGDKLGILRVGAASSTSSKPFTLAGDGRGGFWVDHDTTTPTLTLSGKISGGGKLVKLGARDNGEATTLELTNGNNDWSGGTLITDGYISVSAANRLGGGAVTLDYRPQYITNSGQGHSSIAGLKFTGDTTIDAAGVTPRSIVIEPGVGSVGGIIDVTTTNSTLAGAGALSGAGTLKKLGTGTLTISGDNSGYTGITDIQLGQVIAANNSALGPAGTATVGYVQIRNDLSSVLELTNNVTVDKAVIYLGTPRSTNAGNVGSGPQIAAAGASSDELTGAIVSDGALDATNKFYTIQSGSGSNLKLSGRISQEYTGEAFLTLRGAGNGEVSGTIDQPATNTRTGGGVTDNKWSLIKEGGGTWKITGTDAYTGTTTVTNGTLLVNTTHTGGGAYTVDGTTNPGATLGGTGATSSAVTVNAGGILSPGASIESLGTGAVTFNAGSAFKYEINSTLVTADLLNAMTGSLFIDPTGPGVALDLTDLDPSAPALADGNKLTMIAYNGAWNGGSFVGTPNLSLVTIGLKQFRIRYADTNPGGNFAAETTPHLASDRFVTLTAVPELGSFITMGFVGCCAIGIVRLSKRWGFVAFWI